MADIIELKATDLAAMLCSRVCHDLINPVGAIGNGLEVLADPGQAEMAPFARDLIANAAKQSRAKLEFARLAYGASSTAGTDFDTRECERVAKLLFEIEKADLDWQVPAILLPKHKAKLFMNMLLIAAGSVPRGGYVKAEMTGPAGQEAFRLTSKGPKTLIPAGSADLEAKAGLLALRATVPSRSMSIHVYRAARSLSRRKELLLTQLLEGKPAD